MPASGVHLECHGEAHLKRSAGELGLAPANCICDPMDLAALGHMTNCPVSKVTVDPDSEVGDGGRCLRCNGNGQENVGDRRPEYQTCSRCGGEGC